jgi:hypothetical protein
MYNIHSHYFNLFSFLKTIVTQPRLEYLYPFGASSIENIEVLDTDASLDRDPIIFCYDQEPLIPGFNDLLFEKVNQVSKNLLRPVILVTTERDSDALNYFVNKFNFIPCYGFFHIFAAHDWFRGYQYDGRIIPVGQRLLKKKFITFNRLTGNARIYRSLFVGELAKRNLIEQGHVSYSNVCPEHGHYSNNLDQATKTYNLDVTYVDCIKQALDTLPHPLRIDYSDQDAIPNHSMVLSAVEQCMETFLHVVTETCYWETKCHLTEKIFKPIILRQPFVLVGCAHNLEYFKSYGFRTFDRWWDESYDHIEDPVQRLQAVANIVEYIASLTLGQLTTMLQEMEQVLEYNYQLFNSKEFLDSAWKELTNNLKVAVESAPVLQQHSSPRLYRFSNAIIDARPNELII